jgi:uncharacterized protein YegJ (DUF2314 family)
MVWAVLAAAIFGAACVFWRRRRFAGPAHYLIVLLREPLFLEAQRLQALAEEAGVRVDVTASGSALACTVDGHPVTVISAPAPYGIGGMTPDQLASQVREARLREAVREHRAFISFAAGEGLDGEGWEALIGKLGRIVAGFADDEALVLWRADTNAATRLTPEIRERLRAGEAVAALTEVVGDEVSEVDADDPRMIAAVEEARARWSEFAAAVERIGNPEQTLLKAPFRDGEELEHMWVAVESAGAEGATGTLVSRPFKVRTVKEGQRVEVARSEITDWVFVENEGMTGLFTEKLVRGLN